MNISDFTYLLNNPTNLDKTQIGDISAIIEDFPYFQSARAIQLKGLKDFGSFKYNQELKITAAHTTDRSVLFEFITSEVFLQSDISTQIKQNLNLIKSIEVNDFLEISNTNNNEEEPKNKLVDNQILTKNESQSISKLGLGSPLEFNKNETYSFSEWLSLTKKTPINRSDSTNTPKEFSKDEKFALIDAFIANKPKLNPIDKNSELKNKAEDQIIDDENLMTETLARIYVEQNNYDKAIQSYQILSLKYPEKSSLFAIQIESIKVLKKNNLK